MEAELQTLKQDLDDFKLFLYTQLRQAGTNSWRGDQVGDDNTGRQHLPNRTVAIASVEDPNQKTFRWFRAETGNLWQHAEEVLFADGGELDSHLDAFTQPGGIQKLKITVYQNNSPCMNDPQGSKKECARLLKSFFTRYRKKIEMEVVFVALYNIHRPSYPYLSNRCPSEVSRANVDGLRKLQQSGVGLRTFRDEDWKTLHDYWGFTPQAGFNYLGFVPGQEMPAYDLQPEDIGEERANDRSVEDIKMASDLAAILA